MFNKALARRKAAVACVSVSFGAIGARAQRTSQIFAPSCRRVAMPLNTSPCARARGAGAFGGVVVR